MVCCGRGARACVMVAGLCAGIGAGVDQALAQDASLTPDRGVHRFGGAGQPILNKSLQRPGGYDIRFDDADTRAAREAAAESLIRPRQIAANRLERQAGIQVDFCALSGGAKWMRARDGLLTTGGPFRSAQAALEGFVLDQADVFGASAETLASTVVARRATTARTGVTTVWRRQLVDAAGGPVELVGAELRGSVARDGRVVSAGSTLIEAPAGGWRIGTWEIDEAKAIELAAAFGGGAARGLERRGEDGRGAAMFAGSLEDDGDVAWGAARRVAFPVTAQDVRAAWEVLAAVGPEAVLEVYLDAQTGRILKARNATVSELASYRVWTGDSPAPMTPGPLAPDGTQPPVLARTLETTEALDPLASPDGWIPAGQNETLGNNVSAHLDLDRNDLPDLPRPAGSPFRVFDFPINLGSDPSTFQDAAVTQAFYITNWYHDRLYQLGFTEPFANFQTDNFGRGGISGDPISADVQDGAGLNNANFFTVGDGSFSRMQLFLWDGPAPDRDGALDTQIVIHELTHGLSIRLHGKLDTIQSAGMGEGWSDFYALALLAEDGEDPHAVYPVGGYSTFEGDVGFDDNYYFGIRRFPYSTDLTKSPLTLADIDPAQFAFDASIPRNPVFGPETPVTVHNIGEIWCNALWACRANLVDAHGFAAGNELALELVTEAMKLAPVSPTFIQSRDAVLLADEVLTGGANRCLLWDGFASRGMGVGASVPAATTTEGVVESFDVPEGALFTYDGGAAPATAPPEAPATIEVGIESLCASGVIPGTETLHYSVNGGPTNSVPLTETLPGVFEASTGALFCAQRVEYFVSAETADGVFADPPGAPAQRHTLTPATSETIPFSDDFETDQGWTAGIETDTATTGHWERVDPVGTDAQPEFDASNPGTLCYVTGQGPIGGSIGANDVDDGVTTLVSPALDTTAGEAFISYARWFSNDRGAAPNLDTMLVEISDDDGASWSLLEEVSENANAWVRKTWRVSDFVSRTSNVRVRFIARDLDVGSLVEAGVDDFELTVALCESSERSADLNGDGSVDSKDLALMLGAWGNSGSLLPQDLSADGVIDAADLALLLGAWGGPN